MSENFVGDGITVKESSAPPSVFKIDKKEIWQVEDTVFTAVFPAGDEPDKNLVKQCRVHDPHFVPLWCWKVYRTPAETVEKTGHYVIGRYVPAGLDLDDTKKPLRLENLPRGFPFPGDRIFELLSWTIKWPQGSYGAKLGIPECAKPFDERVVEYVKAQEDLRKNHSIAEVLQMLDTWEENDQKELAKHVADAEYELKQHWKAMKKAVEENNLLPGIYEPKPFVEVHNERTT